MKIRRFTPEEDDFIRNNYEKLILQELSDKLNRSIGSVYGRMQRLNLAIAPQLRRERHLKGLAVGWEKGKHTHFKKGHTPFNKGKKGTYAEGSEKGWFKKGHEPHNTVPVGTTRTIDGYVQIKIREHKWKGKHRIVWEQHNGPIPPNCNIQFKDGNRQNCDIENLYLATKQTNMLENTIQRYPPEIKTAVRRLGRIKQLINKQIHEKAN